MTSHSADSAGDKQVYYEAPKPQYTVVGMVPTVPSLVCPFCGNTVIPVVSYEPSLTAWLLCMLVSILFLPIFLVGFLIGYLILTSDAFQVPRYVCPLCGNVFVPGTGKYFV